MHQTSPILDLRPHRGGLARWPATLLTAALWSGTLCLLGPPIGHQLPRLGEAAALAAPLLLLRGRRRSQPQPAPVAELERRTLAESFGLDEAELFRARHARRSTVHHDAEGRIVALQLPEPAPVQPQPDRDAHPVG